MNTYEALVVYYKSVNEDGVPKAVDRLVGEIEKLEGKAGKREILGRRRFARPMKKQDTGYFVRLGFSLEPSQIEALKGRLKFDNEIVRAQFLNVDGEPLPKKAGAEEKDKEPEKEKIDG